MRLRDQVILITGASRGVGAACARAVAREGAHVALAAKSLDDHPSLPGTLREVAAEVEAIGTQAHVLQVDVREAAQVERMVHETVERFGRLDALINNAGAIFWSPIADHSWKRYDLIMGVNARAAFLASHYAIPHLRERGGHIIMMSPPISMNALTGKSPYLLSKFGMTMLAQAIDQEEDRICAQALWPVTGVRTAATEVFGMGDFNAWRKPEILADATVALLARDPLQAKFHAWLDEELLRAEGMTDFTGYRCSPEHEPTPLSIHLIDPEWTPPW